MKKQKTIQKPIPSRVGSKKKPPARLQKQHSRSLHVHIALHPLTILILLCIGVLLVAFTLSAVADSIRVTAVVPAAPLTQPAIVTTPQDGIQTSTQGQTVSGTCPANSYVNLQDNGSFVGAYTCTSGTFQISLDLSVGTNQLQPQDYNITNSPGPVSTSITVTYTPVAVTSTESSPPPVITPTNIVTPVRLLVTRTDASVPYTSTSVTNVSQRPTFSGVAPPGSRVVVAIQANQTVTCAAYANAQGYWICMFTSSIALGTYKVIVSATTIQGNTLAFPAFSVEAKAQVLAFGIRTGSLHITSGYTYTAHSIGETVSYAVHLTGGQAPYVITVSWGDVIHTTFVQQTSADVTISHIYDWINAASATKVVKAQIISADGQASTLQFSVQLRNAAYRSAIANATRNSGLWGSFEAVRSLLWLFWPGYIVVILLVFSFWLGEREEITRLRESSMKLVNRKRRRAPAHH